VSSRKGSPARARDESRKLVIYGAGGHAVSVFDVALAAGFRVHCFIDDTRKRSGRLLGRPLLDDLSRLGSAGDFLFAIAIGDNFQRERMAGKLKRSIPGARFPVLVHPDASVSRFAALGPGTVVMAGARVGPRCSVGGFCIVNTRASIDHDNVLGDYSSFAPRAVSGGGVKLGRRSAVSIGAVVKEKVSIGRDTVIGGNSYVNRNVGSNKVAYGSPARVIRGRKAGDKYLC
jgi:sugar O-acyltransferase (sialic acid O-acetyltransferase NeuD family)